MVMALLCSQYSAISSASMTSLSALKKSVLKDKGIACIVAGGSLALATSLFAGIYFYKVNAQARNLKQKKEEFEKNSLLQSISLIKAQEKNKDYKKARVQTLDRATPIVDCPAIVRAWEKESADHKEMPALLKDHIASLCEEWESGSEAKLGTMYSDIDKIVESYWFKDLEKKGAKLSSEIEAIKKEPKPKWTKLFQGLSLGYLSSLSLMLYGAYLGRKA